MLKGSYHSQEAKDKDAKAHMHPQRIPGLLTDVEKEVLRLRMLGYRNKQIAKKLYLEYQSVKNAISRAYRVLGIHSLREARELLSPKPL